MMGTQANKQGGEEWRRLPSEKYAEAGTPPAVQAHKLTLACSWPLTRAA